MRVDDISQKMVLCSSFGNRDSEKYFDEFGGEKYKKIFKRIKKNILKSDNLKSYYWLVMRMSCDEIDDFANASVDQEPKVKKPKFIADQAALCQAGGDADKFKQLMKTDKARTNHARLIEALKILRIKDVDKFNEFYEVAKTGDCEKFKRYLKSK